MSARIGALNARLHFLELQMHEVVQQARELQMFRELLSIAHKERTGMSLYDYEEISPLDEARAEQLLKLYPGGA